MTRSNITFKLYRKPRTVSFHRWARRNAACIARVVCSRVMHGESCANRAQLSHDPHMPSIRFPLHAIVAFIVTYRTPMPPVRAVHDHLDTSQGQNPFRNVGDKGRYAATGEEVTRKCNTPSSTVTNYGLIGTGCLRKLDTPVARRLLYFELGNLNFNGGTSTTLSTYHSEEQS